MIVINSPTLYHAELIPDIMPLNFGFVFATSRLKECNPALYPHFHTYLMRKLVLPEEVKLGTALLHLDESFTNIYSKATRKRSYQLEWLMTLATEFVLVYREKIALPFVLKLPQSSDLVPKRGIYLTPGDRPKLSDHPLTAARRIIATTPAPSVPKTGLEFDFSEPPEFLELMSHYLVGLDVYAQGNTLLSKNLLVQELASQFSAYYMNHVPAKEIPKKIQALFDRLLQRDYFKPQSAGADADMIALTDHAKTIITEIMSKQRISDIPTGDPLIQPAPKNPLPLMDRILDLLAQLNQFKENGYSIQQLEDIPDLAAALHELADTFPDSPMDRIYTYLEELPPGPEFADQMESVLVAQISV
jgi:hypothetical protein